MARLFDRTQSEYVENVAGAPATAAPRTLAGWVYIVNWGFSNGILCLQDAGGPADWCDLRAKNDGALYRANLWVRRGGALPEATSTDTFGLNSWHHLCGVEYAANSRAALLDGGNKGVDVTACTPAGIDSVSIGRQGDSTPGSYVDGRIAEAAVWNVALTDAEVAILAAGFSPLFVRPQSLVAYWPLIRDEDQDRVGGYDMTAFNGPSIAAHPPIIYPAPRAFVMAPAAAPVVGQPMMLRGTTVPGLRQWHPR